MAKLKEIIDFMEKIAPPEQKEQGDNVGFLVGRLQSEISTCVLCLDVTLDVLEESVKSGAQLIISHHPFIYRPVSAITDQTLQGKKILEAIKHDINIFSAHTNLDSSEQGVNDALAKLLELESVERFDALDSAWQGGRMGYLKRPMTLAKLACKLKNILDDKTVKIAGKKDKVIKKAAFIAGGAGKTEYLRAAIDLGADCYISGDFSHHVALEAYERDFGIIWCSHYSMERVILKRLYELLTKEFSGVKFIISQKEKNPVSVV
ncbi:MAG TPA: Nif3-like dinuclear metal center hexameric protein [Clostridia bacterium]